MTKDIVIFQIDGKNFPKRFQKKNLKLGKILYIEIKDEDVLIKESAFDNSEKYAVKWISPSCWAVLLIKNFDLKCNLVNLVVEQLNGYLDAEIIKEKLKLLASKLRIEHLYKSKEFENSALKNVFCVTERLYMIQKIKSEPASNALFFYWESILTYHLLTCFDLLGQPSPWLDFNDWLISKEFLLKKEIYFAKLTNKEDMLKSSKELYNFYKQEYGTRSAFYRFINHVLPDNARQNLISSIKITNLTNPPKIESHINSDKDSVIRFLFEYRNAYTHKGKVHYGISPHTEGFIPKGWQTHEQIFKEKEWISIETHNWPTIIEKTVKIGLAEFLKNII